MSVASTSVTVSLQSDELTSEPPPSAMKCPPVIHIVYICELTVVTWHTTQEMQLMAKYHLHVLLHGRRKTLISNRGRWSSLSLFRQIHLEEGKL